ncbi:AbrB/MazE/SpoVT family DNA-binding domain-containing protein [Kibdelosporangium lantanae]|uniref:AbrB/MazE/SpoVT family DNA-binding domain-containing protein n=1 Tax=Kibdelosporangium lantanae TaxID=1497396 RepID=A0ABW3M1P2_9PSEU
MATLDSRGRVADHLILTSLDWSPGTRLDIYAINKQSHLHLPAAVRHRCGLDTGNRVLLAALPAADRLVIHPPAALDITFGAVHAELLGGESR